MGNVFDPAILDRSQLWLFYRIFSLRLFGLYHKTNSVIRRDNKKMSTNPN